MAPDVAFEASHLLPLLISSAAREWPHVSLDPTEQVMADKVE